MLNSVVLPAPLGPISPRISPSARVKVTSDTATKPPKRLVTPLTSSKALIRSPFWNAAQDDTSSQSGRREQTAPPATAEHQQSPGESSTAWEKSTGRTAAFHTGLRPKQRR